jgi:hypothetical protein
MPLGKDEIENWFSYHAPTTEQVEVYSELRSAAKAFAYTILALTPPSADQTAAIRHIRDALMTANAAIACGGK